MAAFKTKLSIEQGATFRWNAVLKSGSPALPVNLTGYTARMQIRSEITSTIVLVSLTTANGGITLGGVLGTVSLYITDSATAAITWTNGVYDLELVAPGGDVTRLLTGSVSVSPEVTRVP